MRVIAKAVCFIGGTRHRVGEEFEYVGGEPLPTYLVPVSPEAREEVADLKRKEDNKQLEGAIAAAGPKRDGMKAVELKGADLI